MPDNPTTNFKKYAGIGLSNEPPKSALASAKSWLRDFLAEGEWMPVKEVLAMGVEAGHTEANLKAAKADMSDIHHEKRYIQDENRKSVITWYWQFVQEDAATVTAEGVEIVGQDQFTLTKEERIKYGIKNNEQYGWIRDDRQWDKVSGHFNRERQFKQENSGGRIVLENGEPITMGDLILSARPMEEVENRQRMDAQMEKDYYEHIEGLKKDDEEFDPNDKERVQMQKMVNSQQHVQAGMIGPNSPSQGLAYEDYIKWRGLTPDQIEAEERSYSLGRFYDQQLDGEAAEQVMAANRKQKEQPRDAGGRYYSLPQHVRPRNLRARA